ncbi:hypothetical protein ACQ1Y6_22700, partial [Enterococcus faecalis]|uniref:hypothetical protein n=1 Tax=Enterococcus faecalis TaxID=1351 RepID=UPI00403F766F
ESIKEDVINNFLTVAPYISDIDKKNTLSSTNSIAQDVLDAITVFHEILMKNASKFPNVNITFVHASRGDTDQIDGPNKTNDSYLQKIKDLEN